VLFFYSGNFLLRLYLQKAAAIDILKQGYNTKDTGQASIFKLDL